MAITCLIAMAADDIKSKPPALVTRALRTLWRLAVDRRYRNVMWLRLLRPRGAFQPFNDTKADRYPEIFSFVQSELGKDSEVKILSFGCSTGEEVFSLRDYFPRAAIKGIDINPGNIALCKQRLKRAPDPAIVFEVAKFTTSEPVASYDVIFCMAVFRQGKLGVSDARCDHPIRFQDFAQAMEDFYRCLRPGGLLVIRHSNFRLCDTPVGPAFHTLLSVKPSWQPIFGPDNELMNGVEYPDTVFRRKAF